MSELKLRHEYKQFINFSDISSLSARLRAVTNHDKNTDSSGKYKIKSLYFDNADDKALKEKLIGVSNREKFRLRYYNNNLNFIRLEKKSKIKNLCNKRSARVSLEECKKLLSGDYEWLKYSENALLIEFYSKIVSEGLRPKTIVEYTREPFTYSAGNVRVTIDSNIRTGGHSTNFLTPNGLTFSVLPTSVAILEIKFDAFIPIFIRDIVKMSHSRQVSFSKYVACRMFE